MMLTKNQIHDFKSLLNKRFLELREEIRDELLQSDNQTYIELAGLVHDIGEASVADLLVDIQLSDIDRHVQEIRDIDAALMRIAAGEYGACTDCGDSIAIDRLQAWPTAKRCHRCQVKQEHDYTDSKRPSM